MSGYQAPPDVAAAFADLAARVAALERTQIPVASDVIHAAGATDRKIAWGAQTITVTGTGQVQSFDFQVPWAGAHEVFLCAMQGAGSLLRAYPISTGTGRVDVSIPAGTAPATFRWISIGV